MDNKKSKNNKYISWKRLPNTDTLLVYLDRKDLEELGKCCKRYRKQLEHRVLEKPAVEISIRNNRVLFYELIILNLF
jgi:hypothetical protein